MLGHAVIMSTSLTSHLANTVSQGPKQSKNDSWNPKSINDRVCCNHREKWKDKIQQCIIVSLKKSQVMDHFVIFLLTDF